MGPPKAMWLQFGHGCGAVEIGDKIMVRPKGAAASIRPRLRSRGDRAIVGGDDDAAGVLQFGHGCGAVEISNRRLPRPA